jgi:hypothetical protein
MGDEWGCIGMLKKSRIRRKDIIDATQRVVFRGERDKLTWLTFSKRRFSFFFSK